MDKITRILQLSDLHLFADQQNKLANINTFETLHHVINKISNDIKKISPDLIVITGDISQDYSLNSYKLAKKSLESLPYPIAATMGNHDEYNAFSQIFGEPNKIINKISDGSNWQTIILNSNWPNHVEGQLSKNTLDFLKKGLEKNPDQPTIIFLHHHVIPVESKWVNKVILTNSEDFFDIIDKHKNIKAVACGHVHQETATSRNNVIFLSTPSTGYQFKTKKDDFKFDTIMPGYRWINLHEDGTIQTQVLRIENSDKFIPDTNIKGY